MRKPAIALGLAALFLAGGCAALEAPGGDSAAPARTLPSAARFRFADVPVPAGLALDAARSFVYESPATRAGNLVYTGGVAHADILHFFRTTLPGHGWRLVNTFERRESAMTFEKPGWILTILVRSEGFARRVDINIGPKGSPASERDLPRR